jgi:hypothetical protein
MENNTRQLFDQYIARQAQLNGVSTAAVAAKFAVDPARQQRWSRPHRRVILS